MFNLGWLGNIPETQTPIARLSHFRERAESSSTQPEQEPPKQSSEGDDMDRNPALTEELAQTFVATPVFEDIAEAIETPQDRAHYLPTIVPPAHVIQPIGVNPPPLRIRATREETIAATTDTTKLITNAIKLDGSLKGKVPEAFDGDHVMPLGLSLVPCTNLYLYSATMCITGLLLPDLPSYLRLYRLCCYLNT
jgi:hypothetical protein